MERIIRVNILILQLLEFVGLTMCPSIVGLFFFNIIEMSLTFAIFHLDDRINRYYKS